MGLVALESGLSTEWPSFKDSLNPLSSAVLINYQQSSIKRMLDILPYHHSKNNGNFKTVLSSVLKRLHAQHSVTMCTFKKGAILNVGHPRPKTAE